VPTACRDIVHWIQFPNKHTAQVIVTNNFWGPNTICKTNKAESSSDSIPNAIITKITPRTHGKKGGIFICRVFSSLNLESLFFAKPLSSKRWLVRPRGLSFFGVIHYVGLSFGRVSFPSFIFASTFVSSSVVIFLLVSF
jgi:hypothetical protein